MCMSWTCFQKIYEVVNFHRVLSVSGKWPHRRGTGSLRKRISFLGALGAEEDWNSVLRRFHNLGLSYSDSGSLHVVGQRLPHCCPCGRTRLHI
ncbi:unnamed protein product, partial [Nesidiocoris tenuis]